MFAVVHRSIAVAGRYMDRLVVYRNTAIVGLYTCTAVLGQNRCIVSIALYQVVLEMQRDTARKPRVGLPFQMDFFRQS